MKHGYYWIRHRSLKDKPSIAWLSKQGGWHYFDGSHIKMVVNKPAEILQRISEYEDEDLLPKT